MGQWADRAPLATGGSAADRSRFPIRDLTPDVAQRGCKPRPTAAAGSYSEPRRRACPRESGGRQRERVGAWRVIQADVPAPDTPRGWSNPKSRGHVQRATAAQAGAGQATCPDTDTIRAEVLPVWRGACSMKYCLLPIRSSSSSTFTRPNGGMAEWRSGRSGAPALRC